MKQVQKAHQIRPPQQKAVVRQRKLRRQLALWTLADGGPWSSWPEFAVYPMWTLPFRRPSLAISSPTAFLHLKRWSIYPSFALDNTIEFDLAVICRQQMFKHSLPSTPLPEVCCIFVYHTDNGSRIWVLLALLSVLHTSRWG